MSITDSPESDHDLPRAERPSADGMGEGSFGGFPRAPFFKRTAMPGARYVAAALVGLALAALLPGAGVLACARDGVPSVSADGHLAVLNRAAGPIVPAAWTPFIFKQTARHAHVLTLSENNREVARALPHAVFAYPWRWDFGDHSSRASGTTVRHTYARAGTYRIAVYAYFAVYATWQPFDFVTIHVQ